MSSNFYSDLKNINDQFWWYYSAVTLIPLFIISIFKLYNPPHLHKHDDNNPFPLRTQDKIARIFLFWAPIYYILDTLFTLLRGNITYCRSAFIFHHIISIIFLPFVIKQNNYPWFCCAVSFMHAVLLVIPTWRYTDYIYLIICAIYHYGVYQEPYKRMKDFIFLRRGTWILEISLIVLWLLNCKNTFEAEEKCN